ncbi:MAG: hypothetical protein IKJ35_03590 [Clostridia bacterium]|nr:hypothetical protein [Clostridia bacterium]
MKWVDYREKLGIGFNDDAKFKMLSNIAQNYVENVIGDAYDKDSYLNYCQMVGEQFWGHGRPYQHLRDSFKYCRSMMELVARYIAFYNTYCPQFTGYSYYQATNKVNVINYLKQTLNDINIPFEVFEDEDGVFIFPRGAKELDAALVSEPLEWLKNYTNTHKTYVTALKQYSEGIYIRDVADNLRKALESFLQEFLGNTKNLETNKNEICKYFGEKGVDPGISGLFQPLINSYKNINDRIAKHNDAVDSKLLEFLLYQTGVLIRLVLSIEHS